MRKERFYSQRTDDAAGMPLRSIGDDDLSQRDAGHHVGKPCILFQNPLHIHLVHKCQILLGIYAMMIHESHKGKAVSLQIAASQDSGLTWVQAQSSTEVPLNPLLDEAKEPTFSWIEGIIQIKKDIPPCHRPPQKFG
jgi:hypothetical protein